METKDLNRNLINEASMTNANTLAIEWETVLRKAKNNAMKELRMAFDELVKDFEDNTFIPFGVELPTTYYNEYDNRMASEVQGILIYHKPDGTIGISVKNSNRRGFIYIEYYSIDNVINILTYSIRYLQLFKKQFIG